MPPFWIFGSILTYAAIGALLWKGRTPERIAAVALLTAQAASGLVDDFYIGQFRWAVGVISLSLFVTLLTLSLRYDRWWLLMAAGAQFLVLVTHFMTLVGAPALTWSLVSTRMTVWIELMLLAFFGVWEATKAPYAQPKTPRAQTDAARMTT